MTYKVRSVAGKRVVKYQCPGCSTDLESPLDEAGTRQNCPTCQATFITPGDDILKAERLESEKQAEPKRPAEEASERKRTLAATVGQSAKTTSPYGAEKQKLPPTPATALGGALVSKGQSHPLSKQTTVVVVAACLICSALSSAVTFLVVRPHNVKPPEAIQVPSRIPVENANVVGPPKASPPNAVVVKAVASNPPKAAPPVPVAVNPPKAPASNPLKAVPPDAVAASPPNAIMVNPPKTSDPPKAKLGNLGGAAWAQTKGGDALIQRGLHVWIVKQNVATRGLVPLLEKAIPKLKELAATYKEMARNTDYEPSKRDDSSNANELDAKVDRLSQFLKSPPESIGVQSAYKLLSDTDSHDAWHRLNPFAEVAAVDFVAQGKTNIDGKYRISEIPAGTYFLYACTNTELLFVDWLLPITVDEGDISLDLDSDNATTVTNFRPS